MAKRTCKSCGEVDPILAWKKDRRRREVLWAHCPHCGKPLAPLSDKVPGQKTLAFDDHREEYT
jgi:hypothetical protein